MPDSVSLRLLRFLAEDFSYENGNVQNQTEMVVKVSEKTKTTRRRPVADVAPTCNVTKLASGSKKGGQKLLVLHAAVSG